MRLSPRALSASVAAGRVVIGTALIAVPGRAARQWTGAATESGGGAVAVRGLGARDLALGAVTLLALSDADDRTLAPALVAACAFADLCDGAASLAGRRGIPATGALIGVGALGAAALGAGLAAQLRRG